MRHGRQRVCEKETKTVAAKQKEKKPTSKLSIINLLWHYISFELIRMWWMSQQRKPLNQFKLVSLSFFLQILNRCCHCCYSFCSLQFHINNNNLSGKQLCCYFCSPVHFVNCLHVCTLIFRCIFQRSKQSCCFHFAAVCLFITHFIIIRCRVQPMITDQTVAINMKVRKRFSYSFFSLFSSRWRFFLRIFGRKIRINENHGRRWEMECGEKNHDRKKEPAMQKQYT